MEKLKVLEMFGGIGSPRKALENLGFSVKTIDYVEVWSTAVLAYNNLFNNDYEPQNIKGWNLNIILLAHGSPCQDWSNAGKQSLESGRSLLFLETLNIIENKLTPRPKYIVWENVKGLLNKCKNKFGYCPACNDFINKQTKEKDYSCYENDYQCQNYIQNVFDSKGKKKACHWYFFNYYLWKLEQLGYVNYWKVLNSKDFGIPQNRNRVFVVSIRKDLNQEFNWDNLETTPYKKLKYFLDKEVHKSYYITANSMVKAIENGKIKIIDAGVVKIPLHKQEFNSTDFIHNANDSLIHTIGHNSANNRIAIPINEPKFNKKGKAEIPIMNHKQVSQFTDVNNEKSTIPTITTAHGWPGQVAIPILETESLDFPNYNVLPRNTDGELISGRYNRFWKTDKVVGTIPASDKTRIAVPIDYKKTRDGKIQIDFNGYDQESRVYLSDNEKSLTDSLTTNPQSAKVGIPIMNVENDQEIVSEINSNGEIPQIPELILDKPIEGIPVFIIDGKPYHLRVLTERECWRLMGWKDKDINKVNKLISKTHLYFLAGNAIVIQVLEAIFKELLKDWDK